MIHMGLGIDLPSSSQHSLPMPRGAPTLNHIGAQQLSLWNWVLLAFVVRVTMHGAIDDVGKDKVNIRSAHHSYDGGDNDLPSGQVALTSLHWGSVRSSKAEEKLLSLRSIQGIVRKCTMYKIKCTLHTARSREKQCHQKSSVC